MGHGEKRLKNTVLSNFATTTWEAPSINIISQMVSPKGGLRQWLMQERRYNGCLSSRKNESIELNEVIQTTIYLIC